MATSGTTTFNLPVDEIIEDALEIVSPDHQQLGGDVVSARRSLNLLLIDMQNSDAPLISMDEQTETLVASTSSYNLDASTVDVVEAVFRKTSGSTTTDYPLKRITMEDYLRLPVKAQTGQPSMYALDRQSTPVIYLWPTPDAADTVAYWRIRRLEDITASAQDVEWSFRFLPAITMGLAYFLSFKFNPEKTALLKAAYDELLQAAVEGDRERVTMVIKPRLSRV
jgi:hypothetical protein